jgi:hypothetical protein
MLTKNDKKLIKDTSAEIITGSGEQVVRRRLKTDLPPSEYDSDFGEVAADSMPQYDNITFTGKVFFAITEKILMQIFGEVKTADALIHIPFAIDVIASDTLFIRGIQYRILEIKEAPLKGFSAARLERT